MNMHRRPRSEKLPSVYHPWNVRVGAGFTIASIPEPRRAADMSYAEAKEIALLRQQLRACWDLSDRAGAAAILAQLAMKAANDHELAAEVRRWSVKLAG